MTSRNVVANLIESLLEKAAASGEEVTACGLRDALLNHPDLPQMESKKLYWRVRDRLNRLAEAGAAVRVGTEGARRPIYRLKPVRSASDDAEPPTPELAEETAGIARQLKQDSAELRAEMQRSLGRLEEYKNLVSAHPALREQIKPLQKKEMQHAQRLSGRFQGLLKVRQLLSGSEPEVAP